MLCPACRTDNAEHRKFCKQCGRPLQTAACVNCGSALEPDERFCGECGTAVPAAARTTPTPAPPAPVLAQTAVAERRVVSVLFADLVGFTPLSETRDPESVRELLSGYFDVARAVVGRYGGTIEKFIGDAVMAVWGVPTATEDSAERCVRAAIELVEAVAEYGETNAAPGLAARAGVVTGEVAVTLGASGEGMVAGDAVNTAARVQAMAEPGTVLVDETTRQTTARAIVFVDAGEHELKGKSDLVRLWRPTRVVAAVGGSERVDGLEASFLGRDRELRQVRDAFLEAMEQARARLVSVIGAAGVGKSRLRWEFFKYADGLVTQFFYHSGRCLPYGEGVAYWALAEMVRARLGIAEDEPTDQVATKLDDGVRRWITDETDREFLRSRLGALLGVVDPGLSREELFAGWRMWFERLADHQPVVLVIEDLQWADNGLLDFLEQLMDWSADQPIFVLTFARPELLERRPTWASGRRNAMQVMLDPLPDVVMGEVLDELVPGLPGDVRERIVAQADGIPLYAVELVRSLIDRDLVQPIDGVYRLVGAVDALEVPASLTSLVAARIDALPAEERSLVQGLAVLGGTFPRAAAAAVTDQPAEIVDDLLADLVRREILRVRADRLSPDRGQYGFTQTLLRQVAYDTLSRRDRKARHLTAATHLRSTFPDDGADVSEVIAQHYLDAYEAMPDDADAADIRAEAAAAFARAGQRASSIGAPDTAERAFSMAAELTADESQRTDLIEQAAEAAFSSVRYDDALERFEAAVAAHLAAGNPSEAARVTGRVGHVLMRLGRLDESIARLSQALAVLESAPPSAALAKVHRQLAGSLIFAGHLAEAAPHVEAALALAEALEIPEVLAMGASQRGLLLALGNRPQESLVDFEWAIAVAERNGLTYAEANGHGNAGDLCLTADLPGAAEHIHAHLESGRRTGDRYAEAIATTNLAYLHLLTGKWDEAERICRDLLGGTGRAADEFLHERLAVLYALRGDAELARQALEHMVSWQQTEDMQSKGSYVVAEVAVALAAGDPAHALETSASVIEPIIDALGVRHDVVRHLWPDAMEAALLLERFDRAEELLSLVADRPIGHVPPFLRAQLMRFRARIAAARGDHADVEADFRSAETVLQELGYPYWLARVQLDHARWLTDQGRSAEAGILLDGALPTFERLRAQPEIAQASGLKAQIPHQLEVDASQAVGQPA